MNRVRAQIGESDQGRDGSSPVKFKVSQRERKCESVHPDLGSATGRATIRAVATKSRGRLAVQTSAGQWSRAIDRRLICSG